MVIRRRRRRRTEIDTNTDTDQQHVLDQYLKQVSQRGVESVHATPVYQSLKKILQRNDAETVAAFHSNVLRAVQLRNRSNVEISVQRVYNLMSSVHAIFMRSHAFRALVVQNFQEWMNSSLFAQFLMADEEQKSKLRDDLLQWLHEWCVTFPRLEQHPQVQWMWRRCIQLTWSRPTHTLQQKIEQEQARRASMFLTQINNCLHEYQTEMSQIREHLQEVDSGFELLIPRMEASMNHLLPSLVKDEMDDAEPSPIDSSLRVVLPFPDSKNTKVVDEDDDGIEWEDGMGEDENQYKNSESAIESCLEQNAVVCNESMDINAIVEAHGLGSASYELDIEIDKRGVQKNNDNDSIFQTLRDGILLLEKRDKPMLQYWTDTFDKAPTHHNVDATLQTIRAAQSEIAAALDQVEILLSKWNDIKENEETHTESGEFIPSIRRRPSNPIILVPIESSTSALIDRKVPFGSSPSASTRSTVSMSRKHPRRGSRGAKKAFK